MGPFIRIALRYGVGGVVGYEVGQNLAADPDVIAVVTVGASMAAGFITEAWYYLARKWGWSK